MEEIIEVLKKKDIEKVVKMYLLGALEQNPPQQIDEQTIRELLNDVNIECDVHKTNGEIDGFITYSGRYIEGKGNIINLDFIYALKKKQSIGKSLILNVAQNTLELKVAAIKAIVSMQDPGAIAFYEKLGFKNKGRFEKDNISLYKVEAEPHTLLEHIQGVKK